MAEFRKIIVGYFVIGATMWAGGAITFSEAGFVGVLLTSKNGGITPESGIISSISDFNTVVAAVAVPLLTVWNLVMKLIGTMFWPVTVLQQNGAPPQVVVLLGGTFVMAFLGAVITIIRRS